jgi:hypothetical protein
MATPKRRRRVVDALPQKPIERPTAKEVPKQQSHAARIRRLYGLIDQQLDDFEGRELDTEEKRILVSMVDKTRALMATEADMEAKYGVESMSDVEIALEMRQNGMSDEAIVEAFQDEKILAAMEKHAKAKTGE